MVIDRVQKKWLIVDFSVPFDANGVKKEEEKIRNYDELKRVVINLHKVTARVVPIVVGSLGVVSKNLNGYLKDLGIADVVGGLQTTAVIGTAAILKKVLSNNI